jgi:PAS domain S-box-containing protein
LNIVGYTADELATKAVSDITHPEDWASEQQTIKEKLDGNRSDYLVEKRYVRKDGSIRWVEVKGGFLRSNPHQLLAIANVLDVTKRKQAEEEKRSLESRLQRAEKMEALGTLAGGVAHDLNNVLGIVVGYSEMLRDEIDESNPMRTDVTKIMEGGQRAAAIVQDLLTLARRGVQTKKVVNLNATIMDCQKTPEYEKAFSLNPNVQTKTGLEADLLNILGSPVHLVKTFINLVTNAVEAMPGGGMLTVSTSNKSLDKPIQGYDAVNEGDYVVLSITDTGEGISDRDIKHIFEPFYTKKVMGRSGTGLGLSVSRAHRVVRFSST